MNLMKLAVKNGRRTVAGLALVALCALTGGCGTMDTEGVNAAMPSLYYNAAAVEAAKGNYQQAGAFNFLGDLYRATNPPQ